MLERGGKVGVVRRRAERAGGEMVMGLEMVV